MSKRMAFLFDEQTVEVLFCLTRCRLYLAVSPKIALALAMIEKRCSFSNTPKINRLECCGTNLEILDLDSRATQNSPFCCVKSSTQANLIKHWSIAVVVCIT